MWVVKGAAAVVTVGGADRYLYRGAPLPEGVENLRHLAEIGLIEEVEEPVDEEAKPAAGDKGAELKKPDGRAGLEKLLEYATAKGIEVPEGADKVAVRALIDAHTA